MSAEKLIYWRNNEGKISCPGDSCPATCDNECPIWINTQAAVLMRMEKYDEAVDLYLKVLHIAPDYKEAWNNMGIAAGNIGAHEEAKGCLLRALKLDPNYYQALWGIIIACKNLNQFEEAYSYCDRFENVANKSEADALRKKVQEAENAKNT